MICWENTTDNNSVVKCARIKFFLIIHCLMLVFSSHLLPYIFDVIVQMLHLIHFFIDCVGPGRSDIMHKLDIILHGVFFIYNMLRLHGPKGEDDYISKNVFWSLYDQR